MSTTASPADTILARCNEVLARHKPRHWRNLGMVCLACSGDAYNLHESDLVDAPCDALLAAEKLWTAVTALEEIGRLPVFHDEDGLTIDIAVRANEALAVMARAASDETNKSS